MIINPGKSKANSAEAFKRKDDVLKMYTTTDEEEFKRLIKQYSVAYVVVGVKELEAYNANGKNLNTQFIEKYGNLLFKNGNTYLYKVTL